MTLQAVCMLCCTFVSRDTAGQERYLSLAPLYYRGAHAACIVYDVTSEETFAKAKYWHGELSKNASNSIGERGQGSRQVPCVFGCSTCIGQQQCSGIRM